MTTKPVIFIVIAWLILVFLSACQSQQIFQQRFLQFGTIIDITLVTSDQDKALRTFNNIVQLLQKRHTEWHGWEDGVLTTFNNELVNHAAITKSTIDTRTGVKIPETLRLLIHDSKKYYELSGGLFNPAMGQLIDAWGFHQQATPNLQLISKIKHNIPGMHDLIVKDNHAISMNPYLQLDFGAIAKGLAVKQIARLINQQQIENFIINAGGDIFAQGQKQRQNWRIAIENPFLADNDSDTTIASLQLTEAVSVFTSGNYRRFYSDKNNTRRHHIIDPNSGEPSLHISAVTVLHKNPIVADVAATTLMLTEISALKNMAKKLEIKDFLAISDQYELYISKSMKQKLQWTAAQRFKIHLL